jgi:diphthine synthase
MTLYLIGLGLRDTKDISLRGDAIIRQADALYLEGYTAVSESTKETLEREYQKSVIIAYRDMVEQKAEETILSDAAHKETVLLVVGDPLVATTHMDLLLRAREKGITTEIIHNMSIFDAITSSGLELYKFGKVTSIPFWTEQFHPMAAYDILKQNRSIDAHTLCLLDIKVREEDYEALRKGKQIYLPPRYMTVNEGLETLEQMEAERGEGLILPDTKVIGIARATHEDEKIVSGTLEKLKTIDFGAPLHCLIIPSSMHFIEEEAFKAQRAKKDTQENNKQQNTDMTTP